MSKETGTNDSKDALIPKTEVRDKHDSMEFMRNVQPYVITFHRELPTGGTHSFGSGTLVRWKGRGAVLTARHVIERILELEDKVTYICDREIIERHILRESTGRLPAGRPQWRFPGAVAVAATPGTEVVPDSDTHIITRAGTTEEAYRPDMGIMLLNDRMMERVGPVELFYSLEDGCEQWKEIRSASNTLYVPDENPQGLFGIMGTIGELQGEHRYDPDGVRVDRPYVHTAISTVGPVYSARSNGYQYEYRNFIARDENGNTCATGDEQVSWGGMSGSGLWELVGRVQENAHDPKRIETQAVLRGLVFAEARVRVADGDGPPDVLVCHSDSSVYPRVFDLLELAIEGANNRRT